VRRDDTLEQMDRGGHPTINPFLNPDGEKNLYNPRQPADDVANYLQPWSQLLQENSSYSPSPLLQGRGGYSSPEEAKAAAMIVLPTFSATTAISRPTTPTAASPPTTSTACDGPG
jgi:hypothetical protein